MSDPHIYTVGWICALYIECVAAQAFLDDKHEQPEYLSPHDNNSYTLGRIGRHNVVIAVLPNGEYGISSAAGVAKDMLRSFPNIRIGLLVGIGGGAPSKKHDIRLGDVVVGISSNREGAVIQYDFGKAIQGEDFKETGFLNQAPTLLRTAVNNLRAGHELEGNRIQNAIDSVLAKRPRLQRNYKRPEASSDSLYQSLVVHSADGEADCSTVCDALVRDGLIARKDVLCFEMEAAGLMNHFPCIVIRGICDYSDSHKNKVWQRYAAMTAAAYTKDLLHYIAPNWIDAERKISDTLSGLYEVTEEHRDIAKEQLQMQKDLAAERLSEKEKQCHQLFRLTSDYEDATYEWYKDRIEERAENTCLWFLEHENFQKWINQESGPLLVTADPGCGKSVLAKYLIDHKLPQSATICYFFFKDQDQNTSRQALCALLHQLFSQKPALIKHAMPQFAKDGQGLSKSTVSLWEILRNATEDPEAGSVIVVIDALDECAESEFVDLIRKVKSQLNGSHLGSKLKYLLTCRPYEQITSQFHSLLKSFPDIRIPGEEESEAISQEVNCVITHRINQLSAQRNLTAEIKIFKATEKGIESTIATLPSSINEAYERILNRSKESLTVQKILIKASQTIYDLDLEDKELFKARARSLCGLFISVHHDKIYFLHQTAREFLLAESLSPHSITIRHAHTTLAELCVPQKDMEEIRSNNSKYLDFLDYSAQNWNAHFYAADIADNAAILSSAIRICNPNSKSYSLWSQIIPRYRYDTSYYGLTAMARLCLEQGYNIETRSGNHTSLQWATFRKHKNIVMLLLEKGANIDVMTYNEGHETDIEVKDNIYQTTPIWRAASKGADAEVKDNKYRNTPLWRVASKGYEDIVTRLFEKGADIETKENISQTTPLWQAASKGYEGIVKLLLEKGANIEAKENISQTTPLWRAASKGCEDIVTLLLEKRADIEAKNMNGMTPLLWAARNSYEGIVKLLVDKGADIEAKDNKCMTPLLWAAYNDCEGIVKLLLEKRADIEAKNIEGMTPLLWAARGGQESTVKMLLDKRADIEAKDISGMTPLLWAACNFDEGIVKLLVNTGADIEVQGNDRMTPLLWAARRGQEGIADLLRVKEKRLQ
ncbi:ankyrin repeat-containing domain protein [Trichoderma asperelloides]|nr:ankyrin repeat-containing domain protein [Trichoderma asperelloides]